MYKGSLFLVSALWNYFIIKMSFLLISLFYKKKKSYQNIQVERSGIFVNCLWWSLCSSSLKNVVLILTDRSGGQQPIVLHHPRCVVNENKEFFWGGGKHWEKSQFLKEVSWVSQGVSTAAFQSRWGGCFVSESLLMALWFAPQSGHRAYTPGSLQEKLNWKIRRRDKF